MSVTAKNFYRRPLPPTCVDFASEEGKRLFTDSLMNGFGMDPSQLDWEGAKYLSIRRELHSFPHKGNANIYFKLASQFRTQDEPAYCGLSTLVMVLNALEVDPGRVWKAPWRFYHESMLDCCVPLEGVRKSVRGETEVIVASYDRSQLQQTGTGHFSPLAAYHAETDRVLIMDVARFKYPPHWVKLAQLQKAICSIDPSTKRARGYVKLKLRTNSRPLIAFALKANIGSNDFEICCRKFGQCFSPHTLCCDQKEIKVDMAHDCCQAADSLSEASRTVCMEVRRTQIAHVFASSAVAALLLAWPFEPGYSERSDRLAELAKKEVSTFSPDTRNEIALLTTQLLTLIDCSKPAMLDRNDMTSTRCSKNKTACSCRNDIKL